MSLWYLSGSKKQPEPPRPQIKIGQPERVGLLRLRVLVYSPGLTWGSIKSSDKVVEWGSIRSFQAPEQPACSGMALAIRCTECRQEGVHLSPFEPFCFLSVSGVS
jgi:hypothetical protein